MIDPISHARNKLELRKTACYHLQVELDRPLIDQTLNSTKLGWMYSLVEIEGRIVRRFGWRYCFGNNISFKIHVLRPRAVMFAGPSCIERKALLFATHMEVYLNNEDGELIAHEFKVLENGPTTKPVMTVKEVEQQLNRYAKRRGLPANEWRKFRKVQPRARLYPRIKPATILGLEPPAYRRTPHT